MDSLTVRNPAELARVWGSSLKEIAGDVFEHSTCGILLSMDLEVVTVHALVDDKNTKIRTLQFPFTMAEFEVLLRSVEQDAEAAMLWKFVGREREFRQISPARRDYRTNKAPIRPGSSRNVRKKAKKFALNDQSSGLNAIQELDISDLWIVPRAVSRRTRVDLAAYERELDERPEGISNRRDAL